MRLISKSALTATLAIGVSIGFVGIKPVGADNQDCDTKVLHSASELVRRNAIAIPNVSSGAINPVYDSFQPQPNDPPSGTGGAGSR